MAEHRSVPSPLGANGTDTVLLLTNNNALRRNADGDLIQIYPGTFLKTVIGLMRAGELTEREVIGYVKQAADYMEERETPEWARRAWRWAVRECGCGFIYQTKEIERPVAEKWRAYRSIRRTYDAAPDHEKIVVEDRC